MNCYRACAGFTLIELSIVLVIIGLIVGGVLVGRDLITAATVRAQISQIEKFNTATNVFKAKYAALPGDMTPAAASSFGFTAGNGNAMHGDGDGNIQYCFSGTLNLGCEAMLYWVQLSQANLIEYTFNLQGGAVSPDAFRPAITTTSTSQFLPEAKFGSGNYVAVVEDSTGTMDSSANYFFIGGIVSDSFANYKATTNITPQAAYALDKKMDDGVPGSGTVLSIFLNGAISYLPGLGTGGQKATGTCLDAVTGLSYNVSSTTPNCQLLIQFQ